MTTTAKKDDTKRPLFMGYTPSCAHCGKSCPSGCNGCWSVYYCSVDCQRADWPWHRVVCKQSSSSPPPPKYHHPFSPPPWMYIHTPPKGSVQEENTSVYPSPEEYSSLFAWHWQQYQVARLLRTTTTWWDFIPTDVWQDIVGMCGYKDFLVCRSVCREWSNSSRMIPNEMTYRFGGKREQSPSSLVSYLCSREVWCHYVETLRVLYPPPPREVTFSLFAADSTTIPTSPWLNMIDFVSTLPRLKTLLLSIRREDMDDVFTRLMRVLPHGLHTFHSIALRAIDILSLPPTLTDLNIEGLLAPKRHTGWTYLLFLDLNLRRLSTRDTLIASIAIDILSKFSSSLTDLTWGANSDLTTFAPAPPKQLLLRSLTLYSPSTSHLHYFSIMSSLTSLAIYSARVEDTASTTSSKVGMSRLLKWKCIPSLTSLSLSLPPKSGIHVIAETCFDTRLRTLSLDLCAREIEYVWSFLERCTSLHTLLLKEVDIPTSFYMSLAKWTGLFRWIGASLLCLEIPLRYHRGDYLAAVLRYCPRLVDLCFC